MKQKTTRQEEWEKIKDYNIFATFEDFEEFAKSKPGGKCLRKYTSYPWSKENFFFGTNAELQEYYKTTKEIPFYLKDKIGKKYGHLTVLDFLRGEENELLAKCKCECGNITNLKWEGIADGNTRTCGCHNKKTKNSLMDVIPDIVNKLWDYERNIENPQNIPINASIKYWWKDENGCYQMAPKELIKKDSGTSFPEQIIYYYLKSIFKNVENRFKIKIDEKNYETDIFIHDLNIAIEYDGATWHKNKKQNEQEKFLKLKTKNISLIRIREEGLSESDEIADVNIIRQISGVEPDLSICISYNKLLNLLHTKSNTFDLNSNYLTPEILKHDTIDILRQYKIGFEENNITDTVLGGYYDYEKNKDLRPHQISTNFPLPVYFKCMKNYSLEVAPRSILSLKNINKDCCFLLKYCPCNFNNDLHCEIYDKCVYSQISLRYYSYGHPEIPMDILQKSNPHNYKENLKNTLENAFNKILNCDLNMNEENYNTTEVLKIVVYNSILVNKEFTNDIISKILTSKLSRKNIMEILDSFHMQRYFKKDEYFELLNNKKMIYYFYNNCDKEVKGQSGDYAVASHLISLMQEQAPIDSFELALKLLRKNLNDELLHKFLTNFCNLVILHKTYNNDRMNKLIDLAKTINNEKMRYQIIFYLTIIYNKSNINLKLVCDYIFEYVKNIFNDGDAFKITNFHYNYEDEFKNIKYLRDVLFYLHYMSSEFLNCNQDYMNLLCTILRDNANYFFNNSNKLFCLLGTIRYISCESSLLNDKATINDKDILGFLAKNNLLIFVNYDLESLDNELLYEFCKEIKFYCDRQIDIDSSYLEEEIVLKVNSLSKDFLENLLISLKYVSKYRDNKLNYIGYTKLEVPKAIKAIQRKLNSMV